MLFSGSQLPIPQIHREGDSHVSKAHEHCRRLRSDPSSARSWNRIFRAWRTKGPRSEEHTSELQSRLHLVCRLLLEKKKKTPEPARHADLTTEVVLADCVRTCDT